MRETEAITATIAVRSTAAIVRSVDRARIRALAAINPIESETSAAWIRPSQRDWLG